MTIEQQALVNQLEEILNHPELYVDDESKVVALQFLLNKYSPIELRNKPIMLSKIKLRSGLKMTQPMIASYMDDELREELHGYDYKTEQKFFRAYCIAHKKKFGEIFILDRINPGV